MRLITKLLVVGLALSLFLVTVSWYYTHYRGDYYFPDRYEDAFGGMLISGRNSNRFPVIRGSPSRVRSAAEGTG